MMRRLGHAVFAAFVVLFLLAQASLIIAWLPSSQYAAIAAGTAYRLVDSVNSTALRIDQLGAGAAVSGTDQVEFCQACGSAVSSVRVAMSAVATYIAGVITTQQNAFVGQQLTPHTLTNASTIAVDASTSNIQTITLSSSGQTMGCPTNVSSGKDATLTFRIKQPASAGPDDLNWDTCYWFPSGTPPKQSNGGLSAANGVTDMLTCDVSNVSGTITSYCPFNGSNNFQSSSQFLLRNNHAFNGSCSSGTTCAVTINNSMGGDLRTVEFSACCTVPYAAPTVSDGTNTCTVDTAAFNNGSGSNTSAGIAYCPKISVSGTSATVTVTWAVSVTFPSAFVQEWVPSPPSPLAGIGNFGGAASGATNPSLATSGATTQTGQLVIAIFNDGDSPVANACTQVDSDGAHNLVLYSTSVSTCSITATASNYAASITSFLHY